MYRMLIWFFVGFVFTLTPVGCEAQHSPEMAQDSPEVDSVEYKKQALTLRKYAQKFDRKVRQKVNSSAIRLGFDNNQPKKIYEEVLKESPEWMVVEKKSAEIVLLLQEKWMLGNIYFTAAPKNPFVVHITVKSCRESGKPFIRVVRSFFYYQEGGIKSERSKSESIQKSEAPQCLNYATSNAK